MEARATLWEAMLVHYERRLQAYVIDVRQLLKEFIQAGDQNGASLTLGHPESLSSRLKALHGSAFGSHTSRTHRNGSLISQAYQIYQGFSEADFDSLRFSKAVKLRECLGFLRRLQITYNVLVRAAKQLPDFSQISITPVQGPTTRKNKTAKGKATSSGREGWTVAQIFQYLDIPFDDDYVQRLMDGTGNKKKWTKNKLFQEFNRLRSSNGETHAEMQLLPLFAQAISANEDVIKYMGCSKKSCFLCWNFLEIFAGLKTRGCHGKLYNLWGIPDFGGMPEIQEKRVTQVVLELESRLKRQLLRTDRRLTPHAKESTVGDGSSVATIIPRFQNLPRSTELQVSEHLNNDRANAQAAGLGV